MLRGSAGFPTPVLYVVSSVHAAQAWAQVLVPTVPAELAPLVANSPIFAELTPKGVALQLAVIAFFSAGAAIGRAEPDGRVPYEAGTDSYNPEASDQFYNERPLLVAKRLLSLGRLTTTFTAGVLWDWLVLGKLFKDEEYKALKAAEPRVWLGLEPIPLASPHAVRSAPLPFLLSQSFGGDSRLSRPRQGGSHPVRAARANFHQARPGPIHPHRPDPRSLCPRAPPAPGRGPSLPVAASLRRAPEAARRQRSQPVL